MTTPRIRLSTLFAFLLIAGTALAVTEAELETTADALLADYQTLGAGIAACPDGACTSAENLVNELGTLGQKLGQLQSARATLSGCQCVELDSTIGDIDEFDDTLGLTVGNWDDIH